MHVMTPQLLFEIAAIPGIPRELTDSAMSKKMDFGPCEEVQAAKATVWKILRTLEFRY